MEVENPRLHAVERLQISDLEQWEAGRHIAVQSSPCHNPKRLLAATVRKRNSGFLHSEPNHVELNAKPGLSN
jgi:hypothetical protein